MCVIACVFSSDAETVTLIAANVTEMGTFCLLQSQPVLGARALGTWNELDGRMNNKQVDED